MVLISFTFKIILPDKHYFWYFTDEEIETSSGQGQPVSAELGLEPQFVLTQKPVPLLYFLGTYSIHTGMHIS